MLDNQWRDRCDLNHLMPLSLWIISLENGAASTARLMLMLVDLVNPLDRHMLPLGSWITGLSATCAGSAFTPL